MRWIYCNPADDGTRATELGCGWFPTVPGEFANIAVEPCVILAGAGQQVVLPDNGLTADDVMTAAEPLQAAENAVATSPDVQHVTVDAQALSDAQAKIATATTVAALRSAIQSALDLLNPGT